METPGMEPKRTEPKRIVLVGGGVRTGKSALALDRAHRTGRRGVFVATARALDDEMRDRVARHREERGDAFETIEEPVDLAGALTGRTDDEVVVVDCLTFWIANLVLEDLDEPAVAARVAGLVDVLLETPASVILVTNEVGMGIVPDNALSRTFRDATGRAHQRIAAIADEIYFAVLGSMLRLKPGPVELVSPFGPQEHPA